MGVKIHKGRHKRQASFFLTAPAIQNGIRPGCHSLYFFFAAGETGVNFPDNAVFNKH
jgi:hypothetical protein